MTLYFGDYLNDYESEVDTCRKDELPKIYYSGWTDEQILEQRTFTNGKILALVEQEEIKF